MTGVLFAFQAGSFKTGFQLDCSMKKLKCAPMHYPKLLTSLEELGESQAGVRQHVKAGIAVML